MAERNHDLPSVSVLLVNYNGQGVLQECLTAVLATEYPKELLEVIMVDNNSRDNSVAYVRRNFPWVKIIPSKTNLGFAEGNNLAYANASGELIALLNTDTQVRPNWLRPMVESLKKNKDAGLISPKLLYSTPYIPATIHSTVATRAEMNDGVDFTPLGIRVEDVQTSSKDKVVWYDSGFLVSHDGTAINRWTREEARILLPFSQSAAVNSYTFTLHGHKYKNHIKSFFRLNVAGKKKKEDSLEPFQVKQFTIRLDHSDIPNSKLIWLVQNAGNCVTKSGFGRDRGSVVTQSRPQHIEFYEESKNYFDQEVELLAVCGGCFLARREVIEQLGLFDPDYFMYYEDLDFSLRVWRAGWNIRYCPESEILHRHKATTNTRESDFFLKHVEKNHLMFTWTHLGLLSSLYETYLFLRRCVGTEINALLYQVSGHFARYKEWQSKRQSRREALLFLIRNSYSILRKRSRQDTLSLRSRQEMQPLLY